MDCREIRDRLAFFVDGELPLSETDRIQNHLKTCDACARIAASEGSFRELLGKLEFHPAPPGLQTRIRARFDAEERSPRISWRWLLSRPVLGSAVAVLLVAFLVAVRPDGREPVPREASRVSLLPALAHMEGELVCAGCAVAGVGIEAQRQCRKFGHVTGLRAADGKIWRFVDRPSIQDLLYDPPRRGERVDVEGKVYPDIRYIDVARVSNI